jgi:hypothetical protein
LTVIESIGVDIGPAGAAASRAPAAARAGARIVRLRLALEGRGTVGDALLTEARAAVESAREARLRVIAVVDSDLTVAPEVVDGRGVPASVASAWGRELSNNASRLAAALAPHVAAWEILPGPNWRGAAGGAPRMTPVRWAELLGIVGPELRRAAPEATIVAGALISDAEDDGVEYLREAASAGQWSHGAPFHALAIQLAVMPEGGPSESVVAATVAERVQRLWRTASSAIGGERRPEGLWVTGLSWDAVYAGEAAQARNLWTAFDTLTADPVIRAVIWTGLVDVRSASGLFAGRSLEASDRRPAWRAFNDFATYARQISPAPPILTPDDDDLSDLPPARSWKPANPWPRARWMSGRSAIAKAGNRQETAWAGSPVPIARPWIPRAIPTTRASPTSSRASRRWRWARRSFATMQQQTSIATTWARTSIATVQ